ncbi:molecular chaperone TorD family protein [Ruegeria sp. 2205SS24-7]|uniref:molecular chaperone TorD family protein n=1 Tax=Ruegeria discodermiae TaxID=3064389 RepID=UPI00274190EE|nr:molecular chaperone TorD family protein [Ruegeria sp. 2205SS24-7]MDP5220197.1 molecular chaperone TorD family protein [Ruegeria sp. 2205SS24-7]
MSVSFSCPPPKGDSPARAQAKETIWRLAALAFGHPSRDLYAAITSGEFQAAFSAAWTDVTGAGWPKMPSSPDYDSFEAGYIRAFLHGVGGKPTAALLAGDHEHILAGLTRPVLMLNIAAFYRHFGLQAATSDEGRNDEPDHMASMFELMSVLCHLEARALREGKDASGYRRAQRDFLCRYLGPTLDAVAGLLRHHTVPLLDPTLMQLAQDLHGWAEAQIHELEARVGPFRDPDAPRADTSQTATPAQDLWG